MLSRSPLLAVPFVAVLAGCSANVAASPEAADAEASTVTAVVTVDRTSVGETTRSEVVARFVRVRAGQVNDDALAMVGASLDVPAEGSCARLPWVAGAGPQRNVELLDVGAVSLDVDSPDHAISLAARRVPDVVDLVSGVVYTTRASESEPLPARGHFVLHVAGAQELDVAPLAVEATMSGEPSDLRVVPSESDPAAQALGPVELAWAPSDVAGDVVYVDVATHGAPVSRCTFSDAGGRAVLAPSTLAEGDGTLTVHRLHREPFRARGIDAGELRFDFARALPFHR